MTQPPGRTAPASQRRWRWTVAVLSAAAVLAALAGAGAAVIARGSQSPGIASSSTRTTSHHQASPASAGTHTATPAAMAPAITGSSSSATAASFALFAGEWGAHGGGFTIQPDGSFSVLMRTYRWCTDNPPPCDGISNNVIMGGDSASGYLISSSGDVATGVVTATSDPIDTPAGPITLTLDPSTDVISVSSEGNEGNFCGPRAAPGTCGA